MTNKKIIVILAIMLMIALFTGCNAKYKKQVEEYEVLWNETIRLIDSENINESIEKNNLVSNLKRLNIKIKEIEETLPSDEREDFTVLYSKHLILQEVIEKGLNWDLLDGFERLSIKTSVEILKPENE